MAAFEFNLELSQKQHLSANQIQSYKLLSMCNVELSQFLYNEFIENPLLEYVPGDGSQFVGEDYTSYCDRLYQTNEGYGHNDKEEINLEAPAVHSEQEAVETLIKDQLNRQDFTPRQWDIVNFMILNLDDDGFYRLSAEDTVKLLKVPTEDVTYCLSQLQKLEPYGIFADSLTSCLTKQLEIRGLQDENLFFIVENFFEDIIHGKINKVSKTLNLPAKTVRQYMDIIKTLNPRPLSGYSGSSNIYVIPDVIFEKHHDNWDIYLNDSWIPNYRVNDYYMKMYEVCQDPQLKNYFRNKLEKARLMLNNIEQRRKTILTISRLLLEQQKDFFENNGCIHPMTMNEIAAMKNIHPSTVSRTVKNKYIQYPGGTILMKDLFSSSGSWSIHSEQLLSSTEIKQLIKEFIDHEDKTRPYSDQKITNYLNNRGISISRRAVAKYREEMHICGSVSRKISV